MRVFDRSLRPDAVGGKHGRMTAIDFAAFVNELATVSGETILPFFRTALSIEDKGRPGGASTR